jgi:site-specific DNA-methyltransferase (adenine-specific)
MLPASFGEKQMPLPRKEILADGIELHLGDFRDWMPYGVDDFHHLITDAPYEQISHNATGRIRRSDGVLAPARLAFDGVDLIRDDLLLRAKIKCSGWFISFCTSEGVAIWRDAIEKHGLRYKAPMVWIKRDSMPRFNGQGPAHGHEMLVTAWCPPGGYSKWNGGGRRGLFDYQCNWPGRLSAEKGGHQTEKPIGLMKELVVLFSDHGETVCDPFMGTGTTGEACVLTGRKFIGIEQDEKWFTYACRRLEKALKQADLFLEIPKPVQSKMEL